MSRDNPQLCSGTLFVVGTPIGNLGDVSSRMREVFEAADTILCEDTRVSAKLMNYLDVHTPLERCDENVITSRTPQLIERLKQGSKLAFVSDAGMPAVSDPGQVLVDAALDVGIHVEVIPGPSAVTSALALSGLSSKHFFFEGFLPRKTKEQKERLELLAKIPATLVIFESPKRVEKTLATLATIMGKRRIALVRELTKVHEEVLRGSAHELLAQLAERKELKGECVVLVEEAIRAPESMTSDELDACIVEGLKASERPSDIAKRLAKQTTMARSTIYERVLHIQANSF